jgi:hypothetical protein
MKHFIFFLSFLIIAAFISSCDNQTPTDPALNELQRITGNNESNGHFFVKSGKNFTAHLSGDEEVPPVVTQGQGQAIFKLSKDGSSLYYKLIVANIADVVQSHIHIAPAGLNGPVVAFLFGPVAGGVTVNGVLAEGNITAANLVGPLAGQPLSTLIDRMNNDSAYVNVHTVSFPGGEIRGQIK